MISVDFAANTGRIIVPELLDSLASDDPRAIRSRRELRWINALMGNERWILRQLGRFPTWCDKGILEWGAGEGFLCEKIMRAFPRAQVTGLDFMPRPDHLSQRISWISGDLLQWQPDIFPDVIVANLFLHHLTEEQLSVCMRLLHHASVLIVSEPLRKKNSHFWGRLLHPLLEDVTRHDMHVSIDAGFVRGDLSRVWAEISSGWIIEEWEQWPGAYRSVWRRK